MKKIISLILVLAAMLSFAACGSDEEAKAPAKEPQDTATVEPEKEEKEETVTEEEPKEEEKKEEEKTDKDEKPEEEAKPEGNKAPAEKPSNKPTENKPAQNKPAENKPTENKPVENKPVETPPAEVAPEANKSVGNTLLSDFKAKASSYSSALSLAEALAANSVLSNVGCGAMAVEPGYLTGFDNTEIKGFKEGAMFAPMIGTIPFVGYVFVLEDGVSASDFVSTLKSAANLRWNICTSADEMVAGSSGNKVFFVMSPKSFEEQ